MGWQNIGSNVLSKTPSYLRFTVSFAGAARLNFNKEFFNFFLLPGSPTADIDMTLTPQMVALEMVFFSYFPRLSAEKRHSPCHPGA